MAIWMSNGRRWEANNDLSFMTVGTSAKTLTDLSFGIKMRIKISVELERMLKGKFENQVG